MSEETGTLQITAYRGGSIAEISGFLSDFETAYLALYAIDRLSPPHPLWHSFPLLVWMELGYLFPPSGPAGHFSLGMDAVPPSARLTLERVSIESPGFWEFVGSLNPLEQIRRYLNDRHQRRQDQEYREPSERLQLELENEQKRLRIEEDRIRIGRDYFEFLREMGVPDDEICRVVWERVGLPLTRLGRHQDAGLIGGERT